MKDPYIEALVGSLQECRGLLERIQLDREGRGHAPWPEVGRAGQVLAEFAELGGQHMTVAEGVVYDAFDAAMTRFEAFGDEMERLARTPDQVRLAANFKEFVGELGGNLFGRAKQEERKGRPPAARVPGPAPAPRPRKGR